MLDTKLYATAVHRLSKLSKLLVNVTNIKSRLIHTFLSICSEIISYHNESCGPSRALQTLSIYRIVFSACHVVSLCVARSLCASCDRSKLTIGVCRLSICLYNVPLSSFANRIVPAEKLKCYCNIR